MEMPDTNIKEIALRAMELNVIEGSLGNAIATCLDCQGKFGKGILVLKMDPTEAGIQTFWRTVEQIPDPRFARMASMADIRKGRLSVLLAYPNERAACYVLNLNTAPEWREETNRPFAIIAEQVVDDSGGQAPPERPAPPPLRASDIEQDDFL